ncbi:MAG TPA: hypothetical protein VHQ87_17240, partial [Rhizobacter sp.]|nr:hypothetical protein [Rhizobacter sp.]
MPVVNGTMDGHTPAVVRVNAFEGVAFGVKRQPQEKPMKRTWTIIGVTEVARSFNWYQSLLGLPPSAPAHDYFGQIQDTDDTVLICLHKWGAHEHPTLSSPDLAEPGNGLLLFFRVDDFDEALSRARVLVGQLELEPQTNP